MPSIEVVLASPGVSSGRPSPPTIVRPRYGEEVFYDGVEPIHITGVGGVKDGWVRIIGGSAGDVIVPVASNGTLDAPVPLGTGLHDLKLAQYTFEPSGVCAPPNPCTRAWDRVAPHRHAGDRVEQAARDPTPTDPTHSPATVPTAFNFVGLGTTGTVDVEDQAQIIPVALGSFIPTAQGKFTGQIMLEAGNAANPLKGWHKVVFKQGSTPSRPVFVSVGIDPPTVEFPRNGAQLSCDGQDDHSSPPPATGTIPYPVDARFGPLHVLGVRARRFATSARRSRCARRRSRAARTASRWRTTARDPAGTFSSSSRRPFCRRTPPRP